MCCHVRSASASRRRRRPRPPLPLLATLDLSKPAERAAHDFLCRATSGGDSMWKLLALRRQGNVLLCVVRWVQRGDAAKPYSLAEVSLAETAVCWQDYASTEAARAALDRRCAETTPAACPIQRP